MESIFPYDASKQEKGGKQVGYIDGMDRRQSVAFPSYLDDYVTEENPVRFVDAFVEALDLAALGFDRSEPQDRGRPAYRPGLLLRLYVYGYLNNIRSSRKLEREANRNIELMWLMERLAPDHKTIANFRKDNLEPIKRVCRQFTTLCKKMNLFGGELVAVDGSKFKADNSRERNFDKKKLEKLIRLADERIDEYMAELDEADKREDETESSKPTAQQLKEKIDELKKRKKRHEERQEKLKNSGEKQLSETDSDARLMKVKQGNEVSYNVQIAVDSLHKLVAEHEVTNEGDDHNQLANMTCKAKQTLGVKELDAVADKGYWDSGEIKKCEEEGITVYVKRRKAGRQHGVYSSDEFTYIADEDVYRCPAGEQLRYRGKSKEKGRGVKYYIATACTGCALKSKCTRAAFRQIKRLMDAEVLERTEARARARPEKLRMRKELAEHPFGTIKRAMGQGYFLMRGIQKVRTEMSMTIMAYNMKRVMNIMGINKMIEALG
jgi:transposase